MNNKERLGSVLDGRMQNASRAIASVPVELGTINANLSLSTDSIKSPIPKGDYMLDKRLTSDSYATSSTTHNHSGGEHNHSGSNSYKDGEHTHSGGEHTHDLPEVFHALKPGDRVLVAWCGNEPVIVAVVVSS